MIAKRGQDADPYNILYSCALAATTSWVGKQFSDLLKDVNLSLANLFKTPEKCPYWGNQVPPPAMLA